MGKLPFLILMYVRVENGYFIFILYIFGIFSLSYSLYILWIVDFKNSYIWRIVLYEEKEFASKYK